MTVNQVSSLRSTFHWAVTLVLAWAYIITSYAASLAVTVALCPCVVLAVVTDAVFCAFNSWSDFWLMVLFSFMVALVNSASMPGMTSSFLGKPNVGKSRYKITVNFNCSVLFHFNLEYEKQMQPLPVHVFFPLGCVFFSSWSSRGWPAFFLLISSLVGYFVGGTPKMTIFVFCKTSITTNFWLWPTKEENVTKAYLRPRSTSSTTNKLSNWTSRFSETFARFSTNSLLPRHDQILRKGRNIM